MAKPSETVAWAESGTAVEPSGAKKAAGWLPGEQPPAEFFNWILKFLGQWTSYLNGLESTEALTWALSQIFNRGITLGADWNDNEVEAISPRITAEPVSSSIADYTLLLKAKDARLWSEGVGSDSALVFTVNATRTVDGADKWEKITTSQPAFALFVSRAGVSLAYMQAAQNTAWSTAFVEGEGSTSGWGRVFFIPSVQGAATDAQQDIGLINNVVNGSSERKLLWTIKPTGSARGVRLYYMRTGGFASGSDGLEIVINGRWVNADNEWLHDVTGPVYKLSFSATEFALLFRASGAANDAFGDAGWTCAPFDLVMPSTTSGATDHTKAHLDNGHIAVVNTKSSDADDANPPAQTGQANKIGVRNVHKVDAKITTGAAPSVQEGYNLKTSNPVTTPGGSLLTLHFQTALDDANFVCTVTVEENTTSVFYLPQIITTTASSVTIAVAALDVSGNTVDLLDLATAVIQLHIQITGRQTT